ncbi:hypothetical protein [Hyphomicrobium sp.]|uniref:hypothetical protein n=1 Tax=Hyphomicrobium sp. TaxID=82 RepID=UPI000FA61736|nr:hypothetical protein [Hyphomicrobium sp.]RUP08600.1 MAG: hypothetical protein EKK38_12655 [Hyphomicrobium sp.]
MCTKALGIRDFWTDIVEVDFNEFDQHRGDLRKAMHCATSLYHMHDWVFRAHESSIKAQGWTFQNKLQKPISVETSEGFANWLRDQDGNFEIIRCTANALKHETLLKYKSKQFGAPHFSSNVASFSIGGGSASSGTSPGKVKWEVRVQALNSDGSDGPLLPVASAVRTMWISLNSQYKWW